MSEVKNLQPTCANCVRFFLNDNLTREEKILLRREIQALCLEVDFDKLLKKQKQISEDFVRKARKVKESEEWQKVFLKTVTSIFKKENLKDATLSKDSKNKLKSRPSPLRMGLSKNRKGKPLHPSLHKS